MTPTRFARRAAACLALGLALATAGCGGGSAPPAKNEPGKADAKDDRPVSPKAGDGGPTATAPAGEAIQKVAIAFLKAVGEGSAKHTALTPAFLKVIGKPTVFESDTARGYSPDAAERWLKEVGGGLTYGLPYGSAGGGAAVMHGEFMGPNRSGRYLIRLVQEGEWKIDWFYLTSAPAGTPATPTGDGVFQEFAGAALLDLFADKTGTPKQNRIPLIAGLLSPELRKAWASPVSQDTKNGYDYSPGQIEVKLAEIGAVDSYSGLAAGPDATVRGELTRAGGKKAFVVKLVKGTGPGQWLVSEFTVSPQG